jgi:hypothetical protein
MFEPKIRMYGSGSSWIILRYLTAIFFRLYRTLPDCINYQSVFDIPIENFLPDRTRRYVAAIDENHCGEVSGVSGSLTIFFYDIKGGYVVHIATIKLAADNVDAWSGQISRNAREIFRAVERGGEPVIFTGAQD